MTRLRSLPRRVVADFGHLALEAFYAVLCLCYGCWPSPRDPSRCDFCGSTLPTPSKRHP